MGLLYPRCTGSAPQAQPVRANAPVRQAANMPQLAHRVPGRAVAARSQSCNATAGCTGQRAKSRYRGETRIDVRQPVPYSLLHISDLHRSRSDPIGNDELISALLADRDRFASEIPPIPRPDAIIVSGDLVRGAPLHALDHAAELEAQHRDARDLLERLADEFLDGERSRLVVVPGNHDVDWNTAFAAMTAVPEASLSPSFSLAMCGPTDEMRWSWEERRAYRITDRNRYEQRLARFDDLVQDFYATTGGVELCEGYRVHSLADARIALVAFNSCVGNDCFAKHGAIAAEIVARAHMNLRTKPQELLAAVWHHSVEGDPMQSDYMSVTTVHQLIGNGFRLGLHGHQHRGATAIRYIHVPGEERMAVVSAGSLCAGRAELPTGVNRQYNLIEVADDLRSARVHVREMALASIFGPANRTEFGAHSYIDIGWTLPVNVRASADARVSQQILRAEQELRQGHSEHAARLLLALPEARSRFARAILLEALEATQDWPAIVATFGPGPQTLAELVATAMALAHENDPDAARALIRQHGEGLDLPAATRGDLEGRLAATVAIR